MSSIAGREAEIMLVFFSTVGNVSSVFRLVFLQCYSFNTINKSWGHLRSVFNCMQIQRKSLEKHMCTVVLEIIPLLCSSSTVMVNLPPKTLSY